MAAKKSKSGKSQIFLKADAKGNTLKEAALQAGYSPKMRLNQVFKHSKECKPVFQS